MRTPSSQKCRLDLAPPWADRFIWGIVPIDYGPVLLLMPFGFHLTVDTPPSAGPTSFCGQRVVTPAFGYGSPHLGARGTLTLLNNALLSAHYRPGRIPLAFHRLPGVTGYTASCSADFATGRGGFLQLLSMTLSPCCPYQPRRSVSPLQSMRRSILPSPEK